MSKKIPRDYTAKLTVYDWDIMDTKQRKSFLDWLETRYFHFAKEYRIGTKEISGRFTARLMK